MFKRLSFIFFLLGAIQLTWSQQLEIKGNGIVIAGDGLNTPDINDGTLYESIPIAATRIHDFVLENTGFQDLKVERISVNSNIFKTDGRIRRIKKGESANLGIVFEPLNVGVFEATVSIRVKGGKSTKDYSFNVKGSASQPSGLPEIMISQYYDNEDNDQIEIKNLTDYDIQDKKYFLAIYGKRDDLNKAPKKNRIIEIDEMGAEEVLVYSKFELTGNELVIISSSKRNNCYADRIDIIGNQNIFLGNNVSFSKGGCATETAHREFSFDDWIELTNVKVDLASANQNISLGAYQSGPISWTNTGWSAGQLPDLTRIVHIDHPYSGSSGNIEACDLIINEPIDFNVGGTNSVIVYRDLTINAAFEIGDNESLVMYDDDATINGSIKKHENSTFRNNTYDFTYWSSPVEEADLAKVFAGVNSNRIYYYDQSRTTTSDKNHPDFWSTWVLASDKMKNGRGYAAEGIAGETGVHEIVFEGKPNNGTIYEDLNFHNDDGANTNVDNDFNMLGNPYPSAINIETFFEINSDVIEPTVYLWTHMTPVDQDSGDFSFDDYATYNYIGGTGVGKRAIGGDPPTKNIGSSQGFFVRAKKHAKVTFNNTMRMVDANDQFFKGRLIKKEKSDTEKDRIWLDLTTNQGGFNQILIGFDDKASDAYDSGYDALKFEGSNKIGFYSVLNSDKLTIQGLAPFNEAKEILLGFDTKLAQREYSISISGLEGKLRDADLILYDNLLNISHDLEKSAYTFMHNEIGGFPGRFSLKLRHEVDLSIEEEPIQEELIISNAEDVFSIVASNEVSTLNMFDLQGRLIMRIHPNQKSFDFVESESRKGEILLLEIQMKDQKRIVKKTYKQ
ncbi:hypothetical protein QWY87_13235 [Lutimonas halocynthiae]|uniref:Ig-like domain-containing protein n=1 Tax=Lutimonas halocynthiae TaxID=1446477 RepID=UPI0025B5B8F8|nr:hypothetical protein [Lutimonas halocynthiae]MDN3643674.1 hypothetical protein [Lutimonas halocynthiae]